MYCLDPNDINVITSKEVKELCIKTKLKGKIKHIQDSLNFLKIISLLNLEDESNLLKNNEQNLLNNLNINVICVNVVLKM
jgi:hypothetical protein